MGSGKGNNNSSSSKNKRYSPYAHITTLGRKSVKKASPTTRSQIGSVRGSERGSGKGSDKGSYRSRGSKSDSNKSGKSNTNTINSNNNVSISGNKRKTKGKLSRFSPVSIDLMYSKEYALVQRCVSEGTIREVEDEVSLGGEVLLM